MFYGVSGIPKKDSVTGIIYVKKIPLNNMGVKQ